jgi:hypothetical protein
MLKYVFREPLTIRAADKADAQKLGEALAKIAAETGGELTPKAVVQAASNPRHLLHRHFTWNDAEAAAAFRLDQARTIIRCVRVEDEDAEDGSTFAYVSVATKGGVSYRSIGDVKGSADLQAAVLKAAQRDLEAFERRYRAMEDVCEVIRKAREMVERKRPKTENRVNA